jgi:pyruvate kinase
VGAENKNPTPTSRTRDIDGYARSKIVCTIGPTSRRPDILKEMAAVGMDVACLNLSHGSFDDRRNTIRTIKSLGTVAVLVAHTVPGGFLVVAEIQEPEPLSTKSGPSLFFSS